MNRKTEQRDRTAGGQRQPVEADSRPPEQTESTTHHIFVMRDSQYRCSRCGTEMNDRSLDEPCPKSVG